MAPKGATLLDDMALLEEVCHLGTSLSLGQCDTQLTSCCVQDVSAISPLPCLPACHHAPRHDGSDGEKL